MRSLLATALGMRPVAVDREALRRSLAGRVVVVTGASRGIGRAVALRCAAVGAHVVLLARSADDLDQLATAVGRTGATASTLVVDLRDVDAATAAGERVVAEHGAPALVVSNAGHSIHRDLADYTGRFHDVARLAGVNMLGPIALALPMLGSMIDAGRGHIVSVGSVGMVLPGPGWSVYAATKAGFDVWLRSVSPELRSVGIATTSIHLPLTHTRMSAPTYGDTRMPALSPDDAATWVCRAVLTSPRVISPWWGRAGAVLTAAAPTAADRLAGVIWRRS